MRMHRRLESDDARTGHQGRRPITEDTFIQLTVKLLPGRRPLPNWLWVPDLVSDSSADIDHWWPFYLRRFDLERTFRFLKQTLGWTQPKLREPEVADGWTLLIIAVHTTQRLARGPVAD